MNESDASPSDSSEIDRVCDRFESALRAGDRPSVQDYLLEASEATQDALLVVLFQLDCAYARTDASEILDRYCARFPQHTAVLRSAMRFVRSREGCRDTNAFCETASYCSSQDRMEGSPQAAPGSALGRIWPLSELPREVVSAVAEQMHEERYASGDALIRQGEPPTRMLVLLEGDTTVHVQDGESIHAVSRAKAPCVLGEMGILSGENCTATIAATTPVRALALPAQNLHSLAARYPVLLPAIGRLIAERLGQNEFDALAGKPLRNYHIEHCIGRGGMAMVYLATDTLSGRKVALKMMSHRFVGDLQALTRFEREFEICCDLHHVHIASVHEHFTAFGTHFIAMEYCPGQTLRQFIQRQAPLPQAMVRKIAGQLAQAISHAHDVGVVHRDIKPSNVMIREDGRLKLMDFGLAKSRSICSTELTSHGQVLGTIRYMPPEQIDGERIDHRADIFAFGCIVYEMLTGKYFFEGDSFWDILYEHQRASLPSRESVRKDLETDLYRVLHESLQKAPCDRVLDLKAVGAWAEAIDIGDLNRLSGRHQT